MAKKQLTAEETYKANQKKAKVLKLIAPICFWGFLVLGVLCLCLSIAISVGNFNEITTLLNDKLYTGEQLQENYSYLIEKYGEWVIGNGGAGFTIQFVNVGRALFSPVMIFDFSMSIFFFLAAFILGKWILPKIAKQIDASNQDMVNLTVLRNSENKK